MEDDSDILWFVENNKKICELFEFDSLIIAHPDGEELQFQVMKNGVLYKVEEVKDLVKLSMKFNPPRPNEECYCGSGKKYKKCCVNY